MLPLEGSFVEAMAYYELYSSSIRSSSACQVRSFLVGSADKELRYGDFEQSPKDPVNIVTSRASSIAAFINTSCTECYSHVATYWCISWPVYFFSANVHSPIYESCRCTALVMQGPPQLALVFLILQNARETPLG